MEAAFHATGLYPDWWNGYRFSQPTVGWITGESGELIRDTVQKLLLGRIQIPEEVGCGAIPKDRIIGIVKAMGINNLADHVKIKHVSGGTSLIFFKSREKGRAKLQGETIDWVWHDEEPDAEIYTECLTRTNNGQAGQFTWMTFTPLKGMTDVVSMFYQEPSEYQSLTMMTIDDVEHYSDEEKQQIIDSYPAHEREARAKGVPILGSGRVFPIAEELITCTPFEIPRWWPRIKGLDFGWDHPTALATIVLDPDNDTLYVTDSVKRRETTASEFSLVINHRNSWIPVSWPHDGLQHDKGSGIQLAQQYRDEGVEMLDDRATFEDGSNGVEAGVFEILDRMRTGRFKVFANLSEWFEEFRLYHRKDGKIVKERDDLMAATRYAMMMLRFAISEADAEFDYSDSNEQYRETGYW